LTEVPRNGRPRISGIMPVRYDENSWLKQIHG
jgi:hypothetical protein